MSATADLRIVTVTHSNCTVEIMDARRLTVEERGKYASWARDMVLVGTGRVICLERVRMEDIALGGAPHILPGCDNSAWIITSEDEARLVALNGQRHAEIVERDAQRECEESKRVEAITRAARETGEEQLLATWTEGCDGATIECSTDIVRRWVCPNGEVYSSRTHCW